MSPPRPAHAATPGAAATGPTPVFPTARSDEEVSWLDAIIAATADAIIGVDLAGVITRWNSGAERLLGYAASEQIGGPVSRVFPAERPAAASALIEQILRGDRLENTETTLVGKDGSSLEVSLHVSPLQDRAGLIIGVVMIARDLTREKNLERDLRFLTQLSERLAAIHVPDELLHTATREIGGHLGADRCYFSFFNHDASELTVAHQWSPPERAPLAGVYRTADLGPPEWWSEMAKGPLAVHDVAADPRVRDYRAAYENLEVRAHAHAPYSRDGAWIGGLSITTARPRRWRDHELKLLETAIARVWPLFEEARRRRELSDSEQRHREMMQLLPVACYSIDAAGRLTSFNEAAVKLWGRVPVIGEEFWCGSVQMAHLDGTPMPLDQCPAAIALREQRPVRGREAFIVRPDGSRRWVLPHPDPIFDPRGNCIGVVNVILDITDERTAQEKMHRAAAHLSLAVSAANLGDWNWEAATDVITFAPRTCEIYGIVPGTVIDRSALRAFIHVDDREASGRAFQAAIEGHRDYDLEYRVNCPDGSLRWVSVKGRPSYRADGSVVGMAGMVQDITPRKKSEEALREARARVEATLAAGDIGTWLWDVQSNRVTADRNLAHMFGLASDENGAPLEDFTRLIHPDDQARVGAEIRAALVSGKFETDYRVCARSGSVRWVTARGHVEYDARGQPVHFPGVLIDITDRKEQEEALFHLSQKIDDQARVFDNALSNITDFAYTFDRHGRFTYVNKPLLDLWGLKSEEALGKNFSELNYPPELAARLQRQIEHVVATRESIRDETPYRHANGDVGYYEYILNAIVGPDGRVDTVAGSTRIITERKRAELASEGQRRVLQLIAEDAPLPRILEELVHTAERTFTGKMAGSILLLQSGRLRHGAAPSLPADYSAHIDGMAVGPAQSSCGTAAWSKQPVYAADLAQHPAWTKSRAVAAAHGLHACWSTPILSSHGDVLGTFAMYFPAPREPNPTDLATADLVTRTAAIAIENKRAAAALRASEEQLRLVIDNAPVLLVRTDTAHIYTFVNRAYAERNQLTPQEMIGKHTSEVLGPKAYALIRPHMETALAGQRVEFELHIPYQRSEHRWIHVIYVPDRNPAGEITGLLAVISDVDAQKRTEETLKLARDEAIAASRAKDDFLAALSHELRTPLNPVLLIASDSANNPNLPASVRAEFEMIRKNVDLEARLIDDLLDLTRITRGKLKLDRHPCDVHLVLQDAIVNVGLDLAQKKLQLFSDFAARETTVLGDTVRLQQVFWNVLKNAVKFTPEKGRITLTTRTSDDGTRLIVKVADTGIGMTPEELQRAFQAFSQGDHASTGSHQHRFGGLGLGLAISKMLVEAHGGHIEASSPGRDLGASFLVDLPLSRAPAGTLGAAQNPTASKDRPHSSHPLQPLPPAGQAPGGALRHRRVLLVEDHTPTRLTLGQLLANRHFAVASAETATEAHQLALAGDFDLLISDIGLPDGNGYDLMLALRARDPRLAGIALSGYGMEADLSRSKAAGFSVHLVKPVSIGMLEQAIASLPPTTA